MEDIKTLANNIKIIKNNSDYRVADILFRKGPRWQLSREQVLNNINYQNTILKKYLEQTNNNNNIDYKCLIENIKKYNNDNNLPIPANDEIVLHLRMGDSISYYPFLKKDYVNRIRNIMKNNIITKITIVTCYVYCPWSKETLHLRTKEPMWNYTEDKQNFNYNGIVKLLKNLRDNLDIPINIYSNDDIDKDFCYCVLSKFFIEDTGGFSELLMKLNKKK